MYFVDLAAVGAVEWSIAEERIEHVGQILLRAGALWNWSGAHEEARRWLDLAKESQHLLSQDQRAELLAASDMTTLALQDPSLGAMSWAPAQPWDGSVTAKTCIVIALFVEGEYALFTDPASAAEMAIARLEDAARDLPRFWSGMLLVMVGDSRLFLGDISGALEAYREAGRLAEENMLESWSAVLQSWALHMLGENEAALESAQPGHATVRDCSDRPRLPVR
jgi:tetratricopeptide (TPR) repeat protein